MSSTSPLPTTKKLKLSETGAGKSSRGTTTSFWNLSDYPYPTDYNDHFETPRQAYEDVMPLIDWLYTPQAKYFGQEKSQSQRDGCSKAVAIYDPYYCNGRTRVLLRTLGYNNVIHEKRDFYADIENNCVPAFDVLLSNPPYSDDHKERCLRYCFGRLRSEEKPFLLLMPAYTAAKQYYRELVSDDVVYLLPTTEYQYLHPEETGKDKSPFTSLWFCGVGKERVQKLRDHWSSIHSIAMPTLVTSLSELENQKIINLQNRPNPRQRRKRRKQNQISTGTTTTQESIGNAPTRKLGAKSISSNFTFERVGSPKNFEPKNFEFSASLGQGSERHGKTSKYRDKSGRRVKKRF